MERANTETIGTRFFALAAALTALAASVRAQQAQSQPASGPASQPNVTFDDPNDLSLLELEVPVVVTAARHEQKITQVPHAISVITAEDIRRSGVDSVAEALRLVAGVDVAWLSYGNHAVSPRGLHSTQANSTLVLVDGRPIFDAVFGGTGWEQWPFQLEDIERIEVIRGPAGVTWGANAVNGVINIITKDPLEQEGLTVTGRGGSRGTFKNHLGYAFGDEKFRMRVSGEYEASDGFFGRTITGPFADEFRMGRMSVFSVYEPDERNTFTLSGGSGITQSGTILPSVPLLPLRDWDTQSNYLLARWTHQGEQDNVLEMTGYVNDALTSFTFPSIEFRYQQVGFSLGHTFKPAEQHTLTWGFDARGDMVDASNADPRLLSKGFVGSGVFGLYAQDDWNFAPRWTLNLGARIDYDTYGGFQPSGRAALSYEIARNAVVYGAVSRAFHMPPGAVRFLNMPVLGNLFLLDSDREIRPQTLIAYEIGYRGRHFDRLDVAANLFWNEYFDMITLSPQLGPPGLLRIERDNRGSATLFGAELDAKYQLTEDLVLLANYTYQEFEWDSSRPFRETDMITPPQHKFMIGTRYDASDDVHLSANLFYVDPVEAPGLRRPFGTVKIDRYFRLDLRAEVEFWDDQASLAVGVRDLLDSQHPEGSSLFVGDADVPRMVYGELRMSLP